MRGAPLLLLQPDPRYNRTALLAPPNPRRLVNLLLLPLILWVAGCVAPLGPGYTIEKQEIRIHFQPAPEPRIIIGADYLLKNTGNQPLSALELRLPGRYRFHFSDPRASWDGTALHEEIAPKDPRNTLLPLPQSWLMGASHTLHLAVEFQPSAAGETALNFSPDAFFLPSEGWSPELLPASGFLSTGGVPPPKWELQVRVPAGFLVHTSGGKFKTSRSGGELTVHALQRPEDRYPFVIAGRYSEAQVVSGGEKVLLWSRAGQEPGALRASSDALARAIRSYDATFGNRGKDAHSLWIVECPVVAGCFTRLHSINAKLIGEEADNPTAELASLDTLMVDATGGTPKLVATVAPALASSWLGYGQNPGFYEQDPPLSEFPAFAAATGREAVDGPEVRIAAIRRALQLIPREAAAAKKDAPDVLLAKSFLFFYALQDRYGKEAFRNAVHHMLDARRGKGFDLDDLIAAFGQETHQNVAEFVRLWMKHPGVPADFRARYDGAPSAAATFLKETTP